MTKLSGTRSGNDIEYIKMNGIPRKFRINAFQSVICFLTLFIVFLIGRHSNYNNCDDISKSAYLPKNNIDKNDALALANSSVTVQNTYTSTTTLDLRSSISSSTTPGELDYLIKLREKLECREKDMTFRIERRGGYWVLKNFFPATEKFKCYETITYTTHGDYTFLDNIPPLLERWLAPISMAIYSPGMDFFKALDAVRYLLSCDPQKELIQKYVTFHFYFDRNHTPKDLFNVINSRVIEYDCKLPVPYLNVDREKMYKTEKKLFYPVNVGRNIAREAANTYFIFPSDVELYPNPGLIEGFLKMYSNRTISNPNEVFVLPIFEVESNAKVPQNKTILQSMLKAKTSVPFHYKICSYCHTVPGQETWVTAPQSNDMKIHATSKRQGTFHHWEPIYICTHQAPLYEEMLTWEGKSDKMTQGYTLCLLDYDFHILSEGFLVHRPGIKTIGEAHRPELERQNSELITQQIVPQIESLYGKRKNCRVK